MGKNYEKFWLLRDLDVLLRRDVDTYAFESSSKLNSMGTRLFICAIWSLLQTRRFCIIHRTIIFATDSTTVIMLPFWVDVCLWCRTLWASSAKERHKHTCNTIFGFLWVFFSRCSDEDESQVGKSFSHICKTEEPNTHTKMTHTETTLYEKTIITR